MQILHWICIRPRRFYFSALLLLLTFALTTICRCEPCSRRNGFCTSSNGFLLRRLIRPWRVFVVRIDANLRVVAHYWQALYESAIKNSKSSTGGQRTATRTVDEHELTSLKVDFKRTSFHLADNSLIQKTFLLREIFSDLSGAGLF